MDVQKLGEVANRVKLIESCYLITATLRSRLGRRHARTTDGVSSAGKYRGRPDDQEDPATMIASSILHREHLLRRPHSLRYVPL